MTRDLAPRLRLVGNGGISAQSDRELVAAFAAEATRAAAAREIMHRYGRLVHRILRGGVGPAGDVQDLVQDVFMRLFTKLPTLDNADLLKFFVASIAVNVLKAQLKQRSVRKRRLESVAPPVDCVWPDHDGREAWRRLHVILDALDPRDRSLFVLRHMEEMTVDEVVLASGVSRGTAKRRLAEAWRQVCAAVAADPVLASYVGRDGEAGR